MKRLRRIIFNSLTVMSLALCVATVGLWVRSYGAQDAVIFNTRHGMNVVATLPGEIYFFRQPTVSGGGKMLSIEQIRHDPAPTAAELADYYYDTQTATWRGCRYGHYFTSMANDAWWVTVPMRSTALLVAAQAAVLCMACAARYVLAVRHTRRRRRLDLCPKCGYDLRTTPERCPECGTIPAKT